MKIQIKKRKSSIVFFENLIPKTLPIRITRVFFVKKPAGSDNYGGKNGAKRNNDAAEKGTIAKREEPLSVIEKIQKDLRDEYNLFLELEKKVQNAFSKEFNKDLKHFYSL